MSIKLVEKEIKRFIKDKEPEVICIMGKWGVGKTFAWNQYLKSSLPNDSIGLKRYSYVSLFGQTSLEGLKDSIFQNTINVDQIEKGASIKTFKDSLNTLEKGGRFLAKIAKYFPLTQNYIPSLFLAVQSQIICIDDLERTGEGLSKKDVLGLISFLKEQRKCKVVLILNDEELNNPDSKDFKDQLEKVVDVEIKFNPKPSDSAELGMDKSSSFYKKFSELSIVLGIVNIRVIRKIEKLAKKLEELLINHDKRIFESGLTSLALLGWIKYQPNISPSLEFIKEFNYYGALINDDKKEKEDEKEKQWKNIIMATGFLNFDEFDQLILDSINNGYFDEDALERTVIELDSKYKLEDENNSFYLAWGNYHNSFNCNDTEVLNKMFDAFKENVQSITPSNADSTICFFRNFNRGKQADELIDYYMKERNENREFYDLRDSVFLELKDPNLLEAFKNKLASFVDKREPEDILLKIAKTNGWNPEDISALANISTDQYYKIFKKINGKELAVIVSQALKFKNYSFSNDEMASISKKAEEALSSIAKESPMNYKRVKSYGILLDEEKINNI